MIIKRLCGFFKPSTYIYLRNPPHQPDATHDSSFAQSAGAVEYTDCTLAEGVRPLPNKCPGYDIEQSNGEVPVMLELWRMQCSPSLPLLPGPPWPDW